MNSSRATFSILFALTTIFFLSFISINPVYAMAKKPKATEETSSKMKAPEIPEETAPTQAEAITLKDGTKIAKHGDKVMEGTTPGKPGEIFVRPSPEGDMSITLPNGKTIYRQRPPSRVNQDGTITTVYPERMFDGADSRKGGGVETIQLDGTIVTKYKNPVMTETEYLDGKRVTEDSFGTEINYPDGRRVTRDEEKEITYYPDGKKETVLKDGTKITKYPKSGNLVTKYPDGIEEIIYKDGTKVKRYPSPNKREEWTSPGGDVEIFYDGGPLEKETRYKGGVVVKKYRDGTIETTYSNGRMETIKNGKTIISHPDRKTETFPDGTEVSVFSDGTKETVFPNGAKITKFPSGKEIIVQPDGKKITTYPDGTVEKTSPDGSKSIVYPSGKVVLTDPKGKKTTILPDEQAPGPGRPDEVAQSDITDTARLDSLRPPATPEEEEEFQRAIQEPVDIPDISGGEIAPSPTKKEFSEFPDKLITPIPGNLKEEEKFQEALKNQPKTDGPAFPKIMATPTPTSGFEKMEQPVSVDAFGAFEMKLAGVSGPEVTQTPTSAGATTVSAPVATISSGASEIKGGAPVKGGEKLES